MEEHNKQDRNTNSNIVTGTLIFKSRHKPLSEYFKYMKDQPAYASGLDISRLKNDILSEVQTHIRKLSLSWRQYYEKMPTVTEYEKIQKKVCLEFIDQRLLK